MTVELPEFEGDQKRRRVNAPKNRISLADLRIWMNLVGQYFVFDEDPSGRGVEQNELWVLGDVQLDMDNLAFSMLCFHQARNASRIIHRAWMAWNYTDFEVVTEFSMDDKRMLLDKLGFVPQGWKR